MSVQQLADIRAFGIERVETVTGALREQVIASHDNGAGIKQLAREAGTSPSTISAWLKA